MSARILQIVLNCKSCPRRSYYSGGAYDCSEIDRRIPSDFPVDETMPDWCPLALYPFERSPQYNQATLERIATDHLQQVQYIANALESISDKLAASTEKKS